MLSLSILVAFASTADAQSLKDARTAYLEAEFREAARQFEAVLDRPSLDLSEAAEAHRYLAALHVMLGARDLARRHAEVAVALDPAVTPPEGAPPEVDDLIRRAREHTGGEAAALHIELVGAASPSDPVHVRSTLTPAPEGLAAEVGIRCTRAGRSADATSDAPRVELEVGGSGAELHCRSWTTAPGGARLLQVRKRVEVGSGAVPATPKPAPGDADSDGHSPWPWVGAAIGVAVVGAAVAAYFLATRSDPMDASVGAPRAEGW